MKIQTFGNSENPVALLIHSIFYPGITSYRTIIPILSKDYYVIVPNLKGLSHPKTEFAPARKQAEEICMWLKENNIDHIAFLLGSSYGSSVAFEILKEQSLTIDIAALDSPALKCSKMQGFLLYMQLKKVVNDVNKKGLEGIKENKKYKYLDKKDEEYCLQVYKNMDKKELKDISFKCYDYTLPSELYRKGTKLTFLFGEKDRAKANLPEVKSLQSGKIEIIEGMSHMQYIFEDPVDFLKKCGLEVKK